MIETLWNHPRYNVKRKTGTYGPAHDPYAYEEIIVKINGKHTIKYHQGIGTYIDVNGVRSDPPRYLTMDEQEKASRLLFQALVGFSLDQIERIHRKLLKRCPPEFDPYEDYYGRCQ